MADYIGICMHYDCTNRNSFGYCKTTACINQNYQHEQWISTSNRTEKVVVKPQTNADRIRAMSDEELAEFIWDRSFFYGRPPKRNCMQCNQDSCRDCWLDWLKREVDSDPT